MARKLHDTYNFDYANLKVLLGGWNTWKQQNAQDPKGYPIETTAGSTPATGSKDRGVVINGPSGTQVLPPANPAPGGTSAPAQKTPAP